MLISQKRRISILGTSIQSYSAVHVCFTEYRWRCRPKCGLTGVGIGYQSVLFLVCTYLEAQSSRERNDFIDAIYSEMACSLVVPIVLRTIHLSPPGRRRDQLSYVEWVSWESVLPSLSLCIYSTTNQNGINFAKHGTARDNVSLI